MNSDRGKLITDLAADLEPTRKPGRMLLPSALWLALASIATVVALLVVGPFRPGAAQQLLVYPRFALESAVGVLAIGALSYSAFRTGIPAPGGGRRFYLTALALFVAWLAFYGVGLVVPALEPSMVGKRGDICRWETLVYGAVVGLAGIVAIRRLWPLNGALSGGLIGLAAGSIPALLMQFACMYVPVHILTHHILPALVVGCLGALVGAVALKR